MAQYDHAKRAGYFECKAGDDLMATLEALLDLRETYENLLETEKGKRAQAGLAATLAGFNVGPDGRVADPLVDNANFCVHVASSGLGTIDAAIGRVVAVANDSTDAHLFSEAISEKWVYEEWVRDSDAPKTPGDV